MSVMYQCELQTRKTTPAEIAAASESIVDLWRMWTFANKQKNAVDNAFGAFVRRAVGWHSHLPKDEADERMAVAKALAAYADDPETDAVPDGVSPEMAAIVAETAVMSRAASAPWHAGQANAEKQITKIVRGLDLWARRFDGERGIGPMAIGRIIGEAGRWPGEYRSVAALWKRMGLAVIDGERQRRVSGEAALEHGYNPARRSQMFVIGETGTTKFKDGLLREVADARVVHEVATAMSCGLVVVTPTKATAEKALETYGVELVVMTPAQQKKHEAGGGTVRTWMHVKNRARRYAEKRLLREVWKECRGDMT